jgi:methyl-accepting chemotaxis protein
MMMKGNENYEKVIDLLRKSKPLLDSANSIEEIVLERISKNNHAGITLSDIVNFFFGWIYIEWVRRSLITASVLLVIIFIYQQAVILKQIDYLSKRTVVVDEGAPKDLYGDLEKRLLIYKFSGKKLSAGEFNISHQQLDQLLESINELQDKYRDLINVINSDPELKKYIEQKLNEKNKSETNL